MAYETLLDVPTLQPQVTAIRTSQESVHLHADVLTPSVLVASDRRAASPRSTASSLKSFGTDDALHGVSLEDKLSFFERLVTYSFASDPASLAATLLQHWLNGRGARKRIPNTRIKNHPSIKDQLINYRNVYLSQQSTDWTTGNVVGGVIPRLRQADAKPGEGWNGVAPLELEYTAKSFDIVSLARYVALQAQQMLGLTMSPEDLIDLDLFASLHSTSLVSSVNLEGTRTGPKSVTVHFKRFECFVSDNYNWDSGKHLTVPNPDYQNAFEVPKPIQSEHKQLRIYHDHQLELERNGMAQSFDFLTEPWLVVDPTMVADFSVDY